MKYHLPYHDSRPDSPNPRLIPYTISCSIFYNPVDDDCLLWNHSVLDISLTILGPEGHKQSLVSRNSEVITPGMWSISVQSKTRREIHVLDFLVLRRQFAVSVQEAAGNYSSKRKASGLNPISAKRPREDMDATEIIFAPKEELFQHLFPEARTTSGMPSHKSLRRPADY